MPTYEYQCQDCGYRVEYFQSIKEPPRTECPQCKGRLSRMVTMGAGLIFKGSGFYITDYKKKGGVPATTGGNGKHNQTPSKEEAPKEKPAGKEKQTAAAS